MTIKNNLGALPAPLNLGAASSSTCLATRNKQLQTQVGGFSCCEKISKFVVCCGPAALSPH